MFLGRVAGDLTSTCRHRALDGARLLWVAREDGRRSLALDTVDAGPGDRVLVLDEGTGAAQVLGRPRGPVRTVIVGVVDRVDRPESLGARGESNADGAARLGK
jgi:ethanolamine utilization protein EutN